MRTRQTSRIVSGLTGLAALAVSLHAVLELARNLDAIAARIPLLAVLVVAACAAARVHRAGSDPAAPRLAATFVLVAFALLPAPSGLCVALFAAAVAGGARVAGFSTRGLAAYAATGVAAGLAERIHALAAAWLGPAHLLSLALGFAALNVLALALSIIFDAGRRGSLPPPPAGLERRLGLEAVAVPLAWVLASLVLSGRIGPALAGGLLVIGAGHLVARAHRLRGRERRLRGRLSSRTAELQTLHAVGREILSTRDYDRVFQLIDRECRKLFDADACIAALRDTDSGELRTAYERADVGRKTGLPAAVGGRLAARLLEEKRPLRLDDIAEQEPHAEGVLYLDDARFASVMATPLIVEEEVVGILALRSLRRGAYDDHALDVLATLGQQAAVALENARNYRMATIDPLTGFYLRDYFFRRLSDEDERVRRYGGSFAVLMIDLDGFKQVNDRHGHLAGDRYLGEVAATVRALLRGADVACRYGGDEFCVLLPATDLAGARAIAERIRSSVADRLVAVEGATLRATASIGVAAFPEHDTGEPKDLLRRADEALYRAKRAGRDQVVPFAA